MSGGTADSLLEPIEDRREPEAELDTEVVVLLRTRSMATSVRWRNPPAGRVDSVTAGVYDCRRGP